MSPKPFLGLLLAIVASAGLSARPVDAAAIAVTTTTDELNSDGDCSLREAVRAANTNVAVDACPAGQNDQTDTITLPAGTYTLTVAGSDNDAAVGDLDLLNNGAVDDLVITGAGAATTIIQACAVDQLLADCPAGQGIADRVLDLWDAKVAISGVTIRHGRAPLQSGSRIGSGIWIHRASVRPALALTDVVVTKNGAATDRVEGGGIANWLGVLTLRRVTISDNQGSWGGGIHNSFRDSVNSYSAELVMTDSTVSGNTAGSGGGILNENAAEATLTNSTISDNKTDTGGGGGFANLLTATATFTDCTISGNRAAKGGGFSPLGGGAGILNYSNAVSDFTGTVVTLTNSTLSGNSADDGAGGGLSNDRATASLTNCTVSGNQAAERAGGINNNLGTVTVQSSTVTANRLLSLARGAGGVNASNPMVLRNTIVAGNFHDATDPALHSPDCTGNASWPVSEGFNLVGDVGLCPALVDGVNGDQIGPRAAPIDAKLGPLADNGGPTPTHALLSGSPAIDAGNPATPGSGGTACPATDQRGETRPSGTACDVGAVEGGGGGGGGGIAVDAVKPTRGGTAGTVKTLVYGSGFVAGATVKLVRPGSPDIVGTATNISGSVLTTTLDLRGAAPGVWSVVAQNPDASSATLTDAFTVEVGGGADLWVDLVLPRSFVRGRNQSIYLAFGNRGTVDAYGVPIWVSFPEELEFNIPFPVSPPPSQPQQVPTDWTRIAIDAPIPPPENRDSFPLLLPIVPAGSTGVLRFRVKSPALLGGSPEFNVTADIGTPYFQPDLAEEVVAGFVARAKEFAAESQATPGVPSDAAIAAYVRTQLAGVVASGQANAAPTGYPPVFSQSQLIIDTAYFIAVASAPALTLQPARRWFATLFDNFVDDFVDDFVGRSAEARIVNPDCPPGDAFCERDDEDPIPCPFPQLCCPIPGVLCIKEIPRPKCGQLNKIGHEWYFIPCPPPDKDDKRPLTGAIDPNDKVGPGGPGGFIDGLTPLPYTINFENLATATGEAYEVTVTDQLDVTKYDLATFSLGPISFGDRIVPVPPGLQSFSTEVDLRPGVNILVGIDAALDTGTGIVTWKFTTLDPATHEFPEDPEFGFLPPNKVPPEGEGAVLFTVSLKPGFGLGTTVCNDARIVFDFEAPIDTPTFCNTIGEPEDCENCVDDDGDQLVDRADPDCTAAPNGAGAGVGDATAGKAVDKCAKTIRKVGTKLVGTRLKQLGACQKAVADCIQLKPGDGACLTKAQAKCTKARTALSAADAKLTAGIVKACGEPTVTAANLRAATGLGFDAEASACAGLGVAGVGTVADVAECIRAEHQCAADRILSAAVPRARELLLLGGFDPVSHFRCLDAGANGGGSAIVAAKRKALRKCDATIQKAATKLVAGRAKTGQACGAAVFTCLQTKPGDPACIGKAGGTCAKAVAGLAKLDATFATAVAKGCGPSPLAAADLLTVDGIGASALTARCAQLGIASLATVADVTACLRAQLTCHVDHLLETTMPRLGELLELGGVALP